MLLATNKNGNKQTYKHCNKYKWPKTIPRRQLARRADYLSSYSQMRVKKLRQNDDDDEITVGNSTTSFHQWKQRNKHEKNTVTAKRSLSFDFSAIQQVLFTIANNWWVLANPIESFGDWLHSIVRRMRTRLKCQRNGRWLLSIDSDGRTPLTTTDDSCGVTTIVLCWQLLWSDAKSNWRPC